MGMCGNTKFSLWGLASLTNYLQEQKYFIKEIHNWIELLKRSEATIM